MTHTKERHRRKSIEREKKEKEREKEEEKKKKEKKKKASGVLEKSPDENLPRIDEENEEERDLTDNREVPETSNADVELLSEKGSNSSSSSSSSLPFAAGAPFGFSALYCKRVINCCF